MEANFVIVYGQLSIGTPKQSFKSTIQFLLTPNPNGRKSFVASFNPPGAADIGHKAFAVVSGVLIGTLKQSFKCTIQFLATNGECRTGVRDSPLVNRPLSCHFPPVFCSLPGGRNSADVRYAGGRQISIMGEDDSISKEGTEEHHCGGGRAQGLAAGLDHCYFVYRLRLCGRGFCQDHRM